MVRAVEQIEQELAALDQTVAEFAQHLHNAYQQYLTTLGQAVRRQLVLAAYHICTQGYPEQFLSLSLQQQQELQQALQRLAKQAQTELLESLQPIQAIDLTKPPFSPTVQESESDIEIINFEVDLQAEPRAALSANPPYLTQATAIETDTEDEAVDSGHDQISNQHRSALEAIAEAIASASFSSNQLAEAAADEVISDRPLRPQDLARWQGRLEYQIVQVLQKVSHATNRRLQQSDILPNRLPEPVLEVASKADPESETASPPNLLNLLLQAESDEKATVTRVIAIRLRLAEIEFGDTATAAQRAKLRQLISQLGKLGREYQRKQQECRVAQAETAWRSSWVELGE
jgi:hypothetical protein